MFGPPPLLEGEDEVAYDELFGRLCAAVKPVDVIDEIFIVDVTSLEWEALRWRRAKLNVMREAGLKALQDFLCGKLDYKHCRKQFVDVLTDYLKRNPSRDPPENVARKVARAYVRNEADALETVNHALHYMHQSIDDVLNDAKYCKAEELAQRYGRREPVIVKWVDKLLAAAGMKIETLMAKALPNELDLIERIDRQITNAESRRDASLREIDRRRAVLGQALRKSLQEVEDHEFQVIEAAPALQPKGKLDERSQD